MSINSSHVLLIAATCFVSAIPATAGPLKLQIPSKVTRIDAEHARLTAMCGVWDVEMTFWFKPGGAGVTLLPKITDVAEPGGVNWITRQPSPVKSASSRQPRLA